MDRWINTAKATVETEDDKLLLEKNARMLVTVWGGNLSNLSVKPAFSYEIFDNLLTTWEYDWCTKTNLPLPENVNPIKHVEKMMRRMEDNFITMHN
ncbi:MAG: hypothetical protein GQ579_03535 [Bacteroidales bacterium]|nr:hypothetical protein [Bacteroidales bacterium]